MANGKKNPPNQGRGQAPPAPPADVLAEVRKPEIDDFNVKQTFTVKPEGGAFPVTATGPLSVNLQRSGSNPTLDEGLWRAIRLGTRAIAFDNYDRFLKGVLREEEGQHVAQGRRKVDLLHGVDAYRVLRTATEAFLLRYCGVLTPATLRNLHEDPYLGSELEEILAQDRIRLGGGTNEKVLDKLAAELEAYLVDGNGTLPYIERIASEFLRDQESFFDANISQRMLAPCLLELIWSYWHEEGMLVQSINAVSLRFQNKRGPGDREPLANFELHPLRPLSNLFWGYIQDEDRRLTVARRAYEYEHHYGFGLVGKAVPKLRPADRRSKFLEAFHVLLHQAALFYERDANTTIIATASRSSMPCARST